MILREFDGREGGSFLLGGFTSHRDPWDRQILWEVCKSPNGFYVKVLSAGRDGNAYTHDDVWDDAVFDLPADLPMTKIATRRTELNFKHFR